MGHFRTLFMMVLACGLCAVSVEAEQDPVARQAVQKASTFVGVLVAARCPSQAKKVQNFLVGKAEAVEESTFAELAIKLGEEKAMSMAEELCEGAADDQGPEAYNDVPFQYANVGDANHQVQTKKHLKRAEEQAFLVAEQAFHEALSAQQIDLAYKEGAGPNGKDSGPSYVLIAILLILIGGGVGLVIFVHVLKARNGGELPPSALAIWANVLGVVEMVSTACANGIVKVTAFVTALREGEINKSNILERLYAAGSKEESTATIEERVLAMSAKIEKKMKEKSSKLNEQQEQLIRLDREMEEGIPRAVQQ